MCVNASQRMTKSLNNNKMRRENGNKSSSLSTMRQLSPCLSCALCGLLVCVCVCSMSTRVLDYCCWWWCRVTPFLQQFNILCLFLDVNKCARANEPSARLSQAHHTTERSEWIKSKVEKKKTNKPTTALFCCNEYGTWPWANHIRTHARLESVKYKILWNPSNVQRQRQQCQRLNDSTYLSKWLSVVSCAICYSLSGREA